MKHILAAVVSVLAAVLISGCYQNTVGYSEDQDAAADGDSDGDSDIDLQYDTTFDGDTSGCDQVFSEYEGNSLIGYASEMYGSTEVQIYEAVLAGGSGFENVLLLDLINGEPGDVADLSGQSQFQTCEHCVLYGFDCPGETFLDCNQFFIATSGTLQVGDMNAEQPWDNHLEFVATDFVVEECTINWDNLYSEIISGGERVCFGAWHAEVVPEYGK